MDEIKSVTEERLYEIAIEKDFSRELIAKDYVLTIILFLLKNVEGIYFKGGTALHKVFLHHARISEDIDFTLTRNIKEVDIEIARILEDSGRFSTITHDKNVDDFLRVVVHYTLFDKISGSVFIDLNARGTLMLKPETHQVHHFYSPFIPAFSIKTLAQEEMIAEKVAATIGRNKPRDHFDVYKIIHAHLPLNMDIVKKKCAASGDSFSIIKMFNKAKMLKNRWDQDMLPLLAEEISFPTIMRSLAAHFKLKEEKEHIKKNRKK